MDTTKQTVSPSDQYRELNLYARHYDQRLWLVPGAAYTLSVVFYSIIFNANTVLTGRTTLALLNTAIFSGFLMQFLKDRCFQLRIQEQLDGFDDFGATVADHRIDAKDRWFIKQAKQHVRAVNYVFYMMLFTLAMHTLVAAGYVVKLMSVVLK